METDTLDQNRTTEKIKPIGPNIQKNRLLGSYTSVSIPYSFSHCQTLILATTTNLQVGHTNDYLPNIL